MKNNLPKEPKRDKKNKREIMFHGIPASPGIACGTVMLVHDVSSALLDSKEYKNIPPEQVEEEVQRFKSAIEETRVEIKELRNRIQTSLEHHEANIFDAHFLIVDDRMLMNEVCMLITKKQIPAETAFSQTMQKYIAAISAVTDPYLRERAADVKDVAARIISHLQGKGKFQLDHLPGPCIIAAKDMTPSDTALLDRANVLAFAIESGSKTSHSAILARSMKIPAIVGMNRFVECLEDGDSMIVDGFLGIAILNPTKDTIELYQQKEKSKAKLYSELLRETQLQSETTDGYRIQLAANMESADNIADVKKYGAAGVGLFRTEYLFMNTDTLPDEEEQFEVYRKVAEAADGKPVVIRTLDLGGDKLYRTLGAYHEQNPFLGLRAIRLCLDNPSILKTQMSAILRAGSFGNVQMMFPMISCMDELNRALELLEEVKSDLKNSNLKFNGKMKIGIMIEIPSAALIADKLARKADFFSIGTNDLVQYSLAVDRVNQRVAHLYQPGSPAIMHLLRHIIAVAQKLSKGVCVCGEMSADPRFVLLLLGLGLREYSVAPLAAPLVKHIVRSVSLAEAEAIAEKTRAMDTAEKCEAFMSERLAALVPNLM